MVCKSMIWRLHGFFCAGANGYAWYKNGMLANNFSAMDEVGATARAVGGMHSICLLGDLLLAVGR